MNNTIGKLIKKVRKRQQLSQASVAYQLHISQSAYAKIESGETKMDIERLLYIAEIFDVPIWEFIPHKYREANNRKHHLANEEAAIYAGKISRLEKQMEVLVGKIDQMMDTFEKVVK